jgi:hypothetical protein
MSSTAGCSARPALGHVVDRANDDRWPLDRSVADPASWYIVRTSERFADLGGGADKRPRRPRRKPDGTCSPRPVAPTERVCA